MAYMHAHRYTHIYTHTPPHNSVGHLSLVSNDGSMGVSSAAFLRVSLVQSEGFLMVESVQEREFTFSLESMDSEIHFC